MDSETDHGLHHSHDHTREKGVKSRLKTILTLGHTHNHEHTHDMFDNSKEGISAVKWSFLGLVITALLQIIVVYVTGSVALLADTIHNFSDAFTSIPLWIAYRLSMRAKSKKYPYGYGKAEDLAGLFIIAMIGLSSVLVFWESIDRIFHPHAISNLPILALAAIIGFLGNEIVAQHRIKVGKEIGSEALIADGLHSRTDGLTSLAVLGGAIGVFLGFPILDPIIGLLIGFMILFIFKDTMATLWFRLLDGSDTEVNEQIADISRHVEGITDVHNVRTRYSGRMLFAEIHVIINREFSLEKSHMIMATLENRLRDEIKQLQDVTIHPDPCSHTLKNN